MPVKRTKLGMTVEGTKPKRPDPYQILSGRMLKGAGEQEKLTRQGARKLARTGFGTEIQRSQRRLPKVKPPKGGSNETLS